MPKGVSARAVDRRAEKVRKRVVFLELAGGKLRR